MRGYRSPLHPFFSLINGVYDYKLHFRSSQEGVETFAKKKGRNSMLLWSETVW